MGPGDLHELVAPLFGQMVDRRVLVGPETGDDAGVFVLDGRALVATVDFITPVCDDPRRFGRVAAANALSDVFAMGATPLFALNLCAFPAEIPETVLREILAGGAEALAAAGAVLLGGHSIRDRELKFGLAVVGEADPGRLLTNAGARAGDAIVLTKPLGTGVLINAFRADALDTAGLEPALVEMERLNTQAAQLGLAHGAHAATDVTGFGLAGHAMAVARASGVGMRFDFRTLPIHEAFYPMVEKGVTVGAAARNFADVAATLDDRYGLSATERALFADPQTSGGLLLFVPPGEAPALLDALRTSGHRAALIGEVLAGPARLELV